MGQQRGFGSMDDKKQKEGIHSGRKNSQSPNAGHEFGKQELRESGHGIGRGSDRQKDSFQSGQMSGQKQPGSARGDQFRGSGRSSQEDSSLTGTDDPSSRIGNKSPEEY